MKRETGVSGTLEAVKGSLAFRAQNFRNAARIALAALLVCAVVTPVGLNYSALTQDDSSSLLSCNEAYAADSSSQSLKSYLQSCSEVTSIESILQLGDCFNESYLITVTQPISWDDPSLGTFEQRVEINFVGVNNVTTYLCGGYTLSNSMYPVSISAAANELVNSYNANFIEFEYRFFGESTPQGLSNNSTEYWQYLTVENAAKDFHHVIEMLKPYLKGTSLFTGTSKGGYTTETQACLFPDDCTCYIAYSAPFCNSLVDPRFDYNLFNTIGNVGMSAEDAQYARDVMMQFVVECYKHKAAIANELWNYTTEKGTLRECVTKETLFDMTIIESVTGEWQYGLNLDEIQAILDESDETTRVRKLAKRLEQKGMPDQWVAESKFWPYYFQTYVQMGGCKPDFSNIREALAEAGVETGVTVTPEQEDTLVYDFVLTSEQKEAFGYSTDAYNRMLTWNSSSDTAHTVMITNGCDTWYAVRIPDAESANIYRYTIPGGNHSTCASALPAEQKAELKVLLDEWLLSNPETALTAPSEGGLVEGYTYTENGSAISSDFYLSIAKLAALIVAVFVVIIAILIIVIHRKRKRKKEGLKPIESDEKDSTEEEKQTS